ncbi:MAG: adenylate kinase [Candidatus Omnitrophota bacterium]|nr:adenylate kinase [Candidatus Omnitrophota bacterium]
MTDSHPLNLVLLGPPGAGKGTQAILLAKAYHLLHISTGDMLREAIKEGSEAGMQAQSYMNRGELVPDNIVTKAVIDRMGKKNAAGGVILDGYPRTRAQAESLDSSLKNENGCLDMVLYLKTSEEVAVQRLSGRLICSKCGKNYHVTNMPPKKEGICDLCGAELVQREDDNPEIVRNRLKIYEQRTKDLSAYYEEKGLLWQVDGDISADRLFEDIGALFRREGLINDDSEK